MATTTDTLARARAAIARLRGVEDKATPGPLLCKRAIIGPSKYVGRATLERPRPRPDRRYPVDVDDLSTLTPETIERFWAKVDRSAGPDACWPWAAGRRGRGDYGGFCAGGRALRSHRVAYALAVGPIPTGMFVCHRCDNPPCCNPAHLFVGTAADNKADCVAKARHATGDRTRPETRAKGERSGMRRHPEVARRGEKSNLAKLTDAQAAALLRDVRAGMSYREASALYGISYSQAYRIDRGTRRAKS